MPLIKQPLKSKKSVTVSIKAPSGDGLPTNPCAPAARIEELKTLIVAPPGWGKTEFAMSNPDALLLAFEEGHRAVPGHKIIIDAWDDTDAWTDPEGHMHCSMEEAICNLENSKRFRYVIFDTVDAMIKILLDYTLPKKKVEHASDAGEYGKGWDITQNAPFRKALNRILKTGRGVLATTHENAENKNFKSGTRAKKETTLPGGIQKQIYAQFELILHGWFGKTDKKLRTRDRILQSEGSSDLLAKNRGGVMPPAFLVPRKFEDRWTYFQRLYKNREEHDKAMKLFEEKGYELE